jgi:XTP/dITP diphosphohydrolase
MNIDEPEEDAETFAQNALIKAKYYGDKSQIISLSDDSGLCIVDLENAPGVHSARFAIDDNGKKNFPQAFEKIFQQLAKKNIYPQHKPKAFFVCNLCLYDYRNDFSINFEGRVDGHITYPALGSKGFGYDPIFIKNGMQKTFGEIDNSLKEQISHRKIAFTKLENWLRENYNFLAKTESKNS